MKLRRSNWFWGAALVIAAACGDGSNTGTGGGWGTGAGTSSTGPGTGGDIGFGAGTTTGSNVGGGCTGSTVEAKLVPLDMFIMLDRSASMVDKMGTMGQGPSKWDAVTQALEAFFTDPQSAGFGAGLQFFPQRALDVPASCSSQADCGTHGPCYLNVCSGNSGIVCTADAECGPYGPCVAVGRCQNDPGTFCFPVGSSCAGNKGSCNKATSSICISVDSCEAADYGTPAVPIHPLNGAASALSAAIDATTPEGLTPTSAALQGAVDYAKTYATANPTHKVVALLATDGLPTECEPLDTGGIASIAGAALAGSPSVATFVIGVFAGDNPIAKDTMDQIAIAGGTKSAFYVDSTQNVNQAFLDALNTIRGAKLGCEYQIPEAPPGETLDYGQVNVKHTPAGATTPETIYYVGEAAGCEPTAGKPTAGGWYYDVDPKTGTPQKIIMCPETCSAFGLGGRVDIQLGCKTELPPIE